MHKNCLTSMTDQVKRIEHCGLYVDLVSTSRGTVRVGSMPDIAKFLGMKDHSSVSKNISKANELIEKDENFKLSLNNLKNKIINKEY